MKIGELGNGREGQDFRIYLQNELLRRCKNNSRYSLRAFARVLKIEPSALSKILNAKRTITPPMLKKLGLNLGLGFQELGMFKLNKREPLLNDFKTIDADIFKVISDWYHYAILELIAVKGFKPNIKWIAKVLDVTPSEVNIAIERLVRVGYLRISQGRWSDLSGNVTTVGNDFTIPAFRNLQRQLLQMAIGALDEVPLSKRDQTSMTMAIDSKLLLKAKEKIKKFRREMNQLLQSSANKDDVYHLSVSLYPATRLTTLRRAK